MDVITSLQIALGPDPPMVFNPGPPWILFPFRNCLPYLRRGRVESDPAVSTSDIFVMIEIRYGGQLSWFVAQRGPPQSAPLFLP